MYSVHLTAIGPELTTETAISTSVAATAFIYLNRRENQAFILKEKARRRDSIFLFFFCLLFSDPFLFLMCFLTLQVCNAV